eukprot:1161635-Pelagomonas_calceolata.AAC.18
MHRHCKPVRHGLFKITSHIKVLCVPNYMVCSGTHYSQYARTLQRTPAYAGAPNVPLAATARAQALQSACD